MKRYLTERPSIKKENQNQNPNYKLKPFSQYQSIKFDKPKKIKNKQNLQDRQFCILKPSKKQPSQIKKYSQVLIQQNHQKQISSNLKFNTIKQITVKYFNKKKQKDGKKVSIKSIDQQTTLKQLKVPIRFSFKSQMNKVKIPLSQRCKKVQSSKNINKRLPQSQMKFYQKIDQQLNDTKRNFKKEKYLYRNQNRSKSQFRNIQPQIQPQRLNNNFVIKNQFWNQFIKQENDQKSIQLNSQTLNRNQRQQMKFKIQINQKIQQNQEQFIHKNSGKFNPFQNFKCEEVYKQKQKNRKKVASLRYVVNPFEKNHIKSKFLKKIPNILCEFLQSRIQIQKRTNLDKFDQMSIIEIQKDEELSNEMFITGEQLLNFKIFDLQ